MEFDPFKRLRAMSDIGFRTRASAIGARFFAATIIFVAPVVSIVALIGIALNETLWTFFASLVETNFLAPYLWAFVSVILMLGLGVLVAYPIMLIARWRAKQSQDATEQPPKAEQAIVDESVAQEYSDRRKLARALPIMNQGPIPAEKNLDVTDDRENLVSIIKLFLRSWPYIKPQFFGHWLASSSTPQVSSETTELVDSDRTDGFSYTYLPLLVTGLAIVGFFYYDVALGDSERHVLYPLALYGCVAGIVGWSWIIAMSRNARLRILATLSMLLLAAYGNVVVAPAAMPEFAGSKWIAWLTAASLLGWLVQFRWRSGRLDVRVRASTHLVYYFFMVYLQRLILLATGLVLTDLLFQSILQADPVLPALANMVGQPDLARGLLERTLTVEERYFYQWVYVGISVGLIVSLTPLRIMIGGGEYSWVMYGTGAGWYKVWILQRINQDLRNALVERWHKLSLGYHSDHRTGDSIFRIYQDSSQVTAVIDRLLSIAMTIFNYLATVFLLSLLSPWLGLLMFVVVAPILYYAKWAMPRMRTRSLVARATASDVASRLQESFSAMSLFKAYRAEERVQRRFEEDSVTMFNAAYRVRILLAMVGIVTFSIVAGSLVISEYLVARWAHLGIPTFSVELIAFIGLSFVIWNLAAHQWSREEFQGAGYSLRWAMANWMIAQDIAMGLRRVFDILDLEPDVVDADDAVPFERIENEVRFENVSFAYEPDRPVLDDVSFSAERGTITAIVGPTGSGKSTLMGLLLRLYDPNGGNVSIDGKDLSGYTVESVRGGIAVALQENVLFAMSVRDNIRYVAPQADESQVREAIRISCMQDYVDELPDGLDTVLGDRGGRLSTGQRQRLSIARAVVRNTPILILDEPTAALDAETENEVMGNLAEWAKGESTQDEQRAIFLITHRISTIRQADNILYLDEGRIIESGSHDQLMAMADGRYRAFVEAESQLAQAS